MTIFICQFCARKTTNAGANKKHENSCYKNPNRVKYERSPNAGMKKGSKGGNQYTKAKKMGMDKPVVSDETRKKISEKSKLQRHTQETRDKISKARIKYLAENPDMVPYKLNHYSKGPSYPERYWKKVFDIHKVNYVEQHPVHVYQLDFAIIDRKIDIEIDGEQHYLDNRIVESDKRRNEYLKSLGWTIIRIRWSEFKKLVDKKDRKLYVEKIISLILDR